MPYLILQDFSTNRRISKFQGQICSIIGHKSPHFRPQKSCISKHMEKIKMIFVISVFLAAFKFRVFTVVHQDRILKKK